MQAASADLVSESVPLGRVLDYSIFPEPIIRPDKPASVQPEIVKDGCNPVGEQQFYCLGNNGLKRVSMPRALPKIDLLAAENVVGNAILTALASWADVVNVHLVERHVSPRIEAPAPECYEHCLTQQLVASWDFLKDVNHISNSIQKAGECNYI